jgi:chemotaxis signal transduction protein
MTIQIGSRPVGLLADRVLDIVSFEAGKIQPVPTIDAGSSTESINPKSPPYLSHQRRLQ